METEFLQEKKGIEGMGEGGYNNLQVVSFPFRWELNRVDRVYKLIY